MRIALIKNGKTENIIIAALEFAEGLGYDRAVNIDDIQAEIGWAFDGEKFIRPEPETPAVVAITPVAALTKFQFLSRLTVEERLGIFSAEATNPMVRMWLETFRICEDIEVTNPETITGVQMLEAAGFIASGRANEILSTNA